MIESDVPRSRFQGSLVGLAIGDAVGLPFEGLLASTIREKLGRAPDFLDAPWRMLKAGQWTDDTKMMIYQARSIIESGGGDASDTARKVVGGRETKKWGGV